MGKEIEKWMEEWLGRHVEDWLFMDSSVLACFGVRSVVCQKSGFRKTVFSRMVPTKPSKAKCSQLSWNPVTFLAKTILMLALKFT